MMNKHNDLNDLQNVQSPPPPWLDAMRETELGEFVRTLEVAIADMSLAAARALGEWAFRFEDALRTYTSSYEWRRLCRALRAFGFLAPLPTPVAHYKAHGRRRSRREMRDIRRQRGLSRSAVKPPPSGVGI